MTDLCNACFKVAFRTVRCERPAGHLGVHAMMENGAMRVDRETDKERRERLLREEGVKVP